MNGEDFPRRLAESAIVVVRARRSAQELREEVAPSRHILAASIQLLNACRQDGRYANFAMPEDGASIL